MSAHPHPPWRRRQLILGGLAYAGTRASGQEPGRTPPPQIIIAGAGMAGLYAAWLLEQADLRVTVLEASHRIGGRNWTVRPGNAIPGQPGQPPQRCTFSEGQYLNAGPWRILPVHQRVLRCADRLGVALEPLTATGAENTATAWQPAGGMDALPLALARTLRSPVRTSTQVLGLERGTLPDPTGVVVWARSATGLVRLEADCAILALPLGLLPHLRMDGFPALQHGIPQAQKADAIKIGLETDGSWAAFTAGTGPALILPPSGREPVIQRIACVYGNGPWIQRFAQGPLSQTLTQARALLRPASRQARQPWGQPLAVQWSYQPFIGAAAYRLPPTAARAQQRLQQGIPPIFWAGDALSPLNGWQEGALASAETTVQALLDHLRQTQRY